MKARAAAPPVPVVRVCALCRKPHGRDVTCKQVAQQERNMRELARAMAHTVDPKLALMRLSLRAKLRRRAQLEREA